MTGSGFRVAAVMTAAVLVLTACGDDGGSTATSDPADTSAAPPAGEGVVVVAQADPPDDDGDGISDVAPIPGTVVEVGQTALLSHIEVTVASIDPTPDDTIEVSMQVANVGELDDVVPDTYAVCPSDGAQGGIGTEQGDISYLDALPAGESAEGTLVVEALPNCPDPLLQVRVPSLEGGFDHIAEWPVP